jgi:Na+-translocating ferredoxin:NAD+ oxidoreductase subunit B
MRGRDIAMNSATLVERIDALLPQTQCGKCGYPGCRPYAQALADGVTTINRCPPGGASGISALAELLQTPILPLAPECGTERPRTLAQIDEANCIGCTLCIQACPVDAIVGAAKQMHTVLADWCTGCELCVPPCPVDCIALPVHPIPTISPAFAALSRERYQRRSARLQRVEAERVERRSAKAASVAETPDARKRRIVDAAVAAAKLRASAS